METETEQEQYGCGLDDWDIEDDEEYRQFCVAPKGELRWQN